MKFNYQPRNDAAPGEGDAGMEAAELEWMDAAPVLRELAEQAAAMGTAKQIHVSLQLDAEGLPVRANETRLRRLLLILGDNAVKFTPFGGRVAVEGRMSATEVTLSVADTGVGISPDDRPRIFERFRRADKVRSRESGGTGLGLPIARQIAEQHCATFDLQGDVGRGSSFTVPLPITSRQPGDAEK